MKDKIKVGSKVRYLGFDGKRQAADWSPPVGTIGEVIAPRKDDAMIQWPKGTTSDDDRWWCAYRYLELIEEEKPKTRVECKHLGYDADGDYCKIGKGCGVNSRCIKLRGQFCTWHESEDDVEEEVKDLDIPSRYVKIKDAYDTLIKDYQNKIKQLQELKERLDLTEKECEEHDKMGHALDDELRTWQQSYEEKCTEYNRLEQSLIEERETWEKEFDALQERALSAEEEVVTLKKEIDELKDIRNLYNEAFRTFKEKYLYNMHHTPSYAIPPKRTQEYFDELLNAGVFPEVDCKNEKTE